MKISLNIQIFFGALFGVVAGFVLHSLGKDHPLFGPIIYSSEIVGGVFVDLLKMILIPLVFTSIVVGIANLRAHAQMDKVWKYTLIYFLLTSILAATIGLTAMNIFKPGVGLNLEMFQTVTSSLKTESLTLDQFIKKFMSGLFVNPFNAMAQGNVLAVVIFAIFLGVALVMLGQKTKGLLNLLNEFFDVIMLIISWIMRLAPIGIAGLLIKLVATQDYQLFSSVGYYVFVVVGTKLVHGFIVLPLILFVLTKMNPVTFYKNIQEALLTAFSTSSSSATLPVTMRCVEQNLKVDKNIAGFVLPLGATINMDGTALYEAAAALFVANLSGIELNLVQQIVVVIMAVLASIGAPGIPSAGMVTMAMVFQSVGLSLEAIALLIPIDRPLDAIRTMINVEGDCVGSVVVQKMIAIKKISS